jgi:hypothetical protein
MRGLQRRRALELDPSLADAHVSLGKARIGRMGLASCSSAEARNFFAAIGDREVTESGLQFTP